MTKTQCKEIAKDAIQDAVAIAYYKIADGNEYTEDEKEIIFEYMAKAGQTAIKAIGRRYITY